LESARELADARGVTVAAALNDATEGLGAGESVNQPALDRALGTVRKHAEVLDGMRSPETAVADLDANLVQRQAALGYLISLTRIAHAAIAARCAEIGEDVVSYLRRISLPAAETHGNEIEADALEDYVDALIAERLATEPLLLTHAAEALRRDSAALPDEDAGEFRELGGSDRQSCFRPSLAFRREPAGIRTALGSCRRLWSAGLLIGRPLVFKAPLVGWHDVQADLDGPAVGGPSGVGDIVDALVGAHLEELGLVC
jgi:hypothetical protein